MRTFRTIAAAGAVALALTACTGEGGGGGGGAADLPADAAPEEVVAAALGARLENGAAFTFSLDGDLDAIAAETGEEIPPEAEALFADGLIKGAVAPEGGFALSFGEGDGFFEMRAVEEALYLRVDLAAVAETFPDEAASMPDPAALLGQLDALGLPSDLQDVATAALNGEWVGITGLSQEQLQRLAEDFGGAVDLPTGGLEDQQEAIEGILEEYGLADGEAFTSRYLTVSGDGPTYDVAVMAKEFVTALNGIAADLEDQFGQAATDDLPSTDDVPESVEGFTITVTDGAVTEIAGDFAAIATSVGEDTEGLSEGDVVARLALSDLGDQLAVPDATTVDLQDLVQSLMGAMMSGLG